MRVAKNEAGFDMAFRTAQKETKAAFGDDTMYIEHFVQHPKHIEFQIMADKYGNVVHLGERDCSVQRNHQKMIEESPCAVISDELRRRMGEAAVKAAKAAHYENAGGASGHRMGDGDRSDQGTDPDRRRSAAFLYAGRCKTDRSCH